MFIPFFLDIGTRSGRCYSPWIISDICPILPNKAPLRARRPFDLESALARAASAKDEGEADVDEVEVETELAAEGETVTDLNLQHLADDASASTYHTQTSASTDSEPSTNLDTPQDPQIGPVRSKDARRQQLRAETRQKFRAKRRQKCEEEARTGAPPSLKKVVLKRVASSQPLPATQFNLDTARVGINGWTGPRVKGAEGPVPLEEAVEDEKMTLYNWDGESCCPILDNQDRVVAVLAGRPQGSNWKGLMSEAANKIARTRDRIHFTDKQLNNGRGKFPAISVGVSYGGGRQEPGNVAQSSAAVLTLLTGLLAYQCFLSLSDFANGKSV
ncbi:hypothetical protein K435DRAFT_880660 [Dendrothele bispora CBS 962.96]|uniref:Uncharacterized protein n=1 Tax=Dendrothele bispora (strain CBS 962.96) TaxID=1314807 RepID=A0A4V4HAH6_DENBC|nr:hypothetical protein K435DRAFT_880660 [Dendrothele bispora CBS 962.96]